MTTSEPGGYAAVIEGLTCHFGDRCALDRLSLRVPKGKVTGIIGANGAGKTTLIDVLTGLVRPSRGSVDVLGYDITASRAYPRALRGRIGIVSQETVLYEELSATENLAFSARLYGVTNRGRVAEVLDLVGLSERSADPVRELSGGMQRRLTIARALLHEPDLFLFDEPTLGVDVEARHQIWNHVRQLRDEGRTILLATNYLDEAEALCDVVAVLRAGTVVACDTPLALVARVGRCLELECSSADADRVRELMVAHPLASKVDQNGERLTVYFAGDSDPDALIRTAMESTRVRGFRVRSPDLMEVLRAIDEPHA